MKQWYNIKSKGRVGTIRIYEQIGNDWFGEGKTAKAFCDEVDGLGDLETLNVHINSPGGNVFDGLAIYNFLRRRKAEVVVFIDGLAASIASIIAAAGDRVVMPENSNLFIHNPFTHLPTTN
jgi:ATP-dependent protease ClpP protease subunit